MSGLGLTALIIGGVALILAFIPFVNFFAAFLAFVGLVFGIIGLVQKGRRKGLAIAGTIVSVVAGLLSVIMIALFAPVFVAAVDDSMTSESTVTTSGDEATSDDDAANDAPSADLGTRDNPAPFGSTVTIKEFGTPTWEVTLGAANLNATANVMAANQFNPDPEPGQVYAIVPATVKYIGSNSATPNFSLQFTYGSADGRSYDGGFVSMEGQLSDVSELYTDAVATGNVVMTIPEAAPETGVWGISYFADDPVFIAIQ